jgi:transcription antitermination protein NusB
MISRRILRIKAMQTSYSYFQDSEPSINHYEKELFHSINKFYDLYHYLLLLVIEIADYTQGRMDLALQKRIPSHEDLNPNKRFVENKIIQQLRENEQLQSYLRRVKMSWVNYPEIPKKLFNDFSASEAYINYMSDSDKSYQADKQILVYLISENMYNCELLYNILEEESMYWMDDIDFVISMLAKTIKTFKIGDTQEKQLMPLFKNEEDKDFVKRLFRKTILHHKSYKELIENHTQNWDIDRIAFLDILIMQMAIAELIEFSSIPTKVTLDEYIEIAKFYSTEKSNTFINGILDKIVVTLKSENKIEKKGRGLIGEKQDL